MDNLGSEISWIKNALIEWKEAMKSGEDATALIEKYCKQDERYANVCFTAKSREFSLIICFTRFSGIGGQTHFTAVQYSPGKGDDIRPVGGTEIR